MKAKEKENCLEKRFTELTIKHQRTLNYIDNGEFTTEQFERLKANQTTLIKKCETLDRETTLSRKTAKKWKEKFMNLR